MDRHLLRAAGLARACLLVMVCVAGCATPGVIAPQAQPLRLADPVRDRIFPLFAQLESEAARGLLASDTLARIAADRRARLVAAMEGCAGTAACYVDAARWSEPERAAAGEALRELCRARSTTCARLIRPLRASGTMIRFHDMNDAAMLEAAWMLQAGSADRILGVYGIGAAPRYAAIDAMGADPASAAFGSRVKQLVAQIISADPQRRPFFADLQQFALALLAIDGRDEAGRYEPMDRGENGAAARAMRRTDWGSHEYTAILVPGQGPEEPGIRLSPGARRRLEAGVARYRQGAAPLLIVSGGHVHPARTPYCEAVEMKRVLMTEFGVPGHAILIDPHARHTTTNVRNAARLLFRHGAPMQRPMLVVTDAQQAAYIASSGFDTRNRTETGVIPYVHRELVTPTEVRVVPSIQALQVGFEDPLDP